MSLKEAEESYMHWTELKNRTGLPLDEWAGIVQTELEAGSSFGSARMLYGFAACVCRVRTMAQKSRQASMRCWRTFDKSSLTLLNRSKGSSV